jgi:hypothetical protein
VICQDGIFPGAFFVAIYERHQPEKIVLYQTVARSWPKISLDYAIADESVPLHVAAEFERYRKCGILDYGFARLHLHQRS